MEASFAADNADERFRLSDDETKAVRALYDAATKAKLTIYSTFELAEFAIVCDLNVDKAVKRLAALRELERKWNFARRSELASFAQCQAISADLFYPPPPVPDGILPNLLFLNGGADFRGYKTDEDIAAALHTAALVTMSMSRDLHEVRRGTRIYSQCAHMSLRKQNFSIAKLFYPMVLNTLPVRVESAWMVDPNAVTTIVSKFVRGIIWLFDRNTTRFFNTITLKKLMELGVDRAFLPPCFNGSSDHDDERIAEGFRTRFEQRRDAHRNVRVEGIDVVFRGTSPCEWSSVS